MFPLNSARNIIIAREHSFILSHTLERAPAYKMDSSSVISATIVPQNIPKAHSRDLLAIAGTIMVFINTGIHAINACHLYERLL